VSITASLAQQRLTVDPYCSDLAFSVQALVTHITSVFDKGSLSLLVCDLCLYKQR